MSENLEHGLYYVERDGAVNRLDGKTPFLILGAESFILQALLVHALVATGMDIDLHFRDTSTKGEHV